MGDTLKELILPFKDVIAKRFVSPLTISYLIAWIVCNYKLVLIILSNNKVSIIFRMIGELGFESQPLKSYLVCFGIPLVTSLVYIFGYERLAQWVQLKKLSRDIKHENDLTKEVGKKSISEQEKAELIAEILATRDEAKKQVSERDLKINDLEKAILQLRQGKENPKKEKGLGFISDHEFRILAALNKSNRATISQLRSLDAFINKTNLDMQQDLNLLKMNGAVIEEKRFSDQPPEYSLSEAGIDYVKRNSVGNDIPI